jgi:uncharacterized protein (DUF849 family)
MIVQACLNGARAPDFHPALPLTPPRVARDAADCVRAGAAELHIHPRGPDGRESLQPAAQAATLRAVRAACPGTLVGVSTGAWIEGDPERTLACIAAWEELPDHASVNLAEPHAPAVIGLLRGRGIGVEAGLASVADAERLVALGAPRGPGILRVLLEMFEADAADALREADAILAVLAAAGLRRPVLLHGQDATVWPLVRRAATLRLSTRVGLEDGRDLPHGAAAAGNPELVAAAARIFREGAEPG